MTASGSTLDLDRTLDARAPAGAPVRVASVPSGHVYVRHTAPEGAGGPVRLPDPDPAGGPGPAGDRWWPPRVLEPTWVHAHTGPRGDVDLVHVHFGFDDRTPEQLAAFVAALRETGTPLVQTVHDLRNPHHADRTRHDAQLDVLVPAADAVLTLTPGAAAEIRRRWGVQALVVPHPHVVDLPTMAAVATARSHRGGAAPFAVGLHLKGRANTDAAGLLPVLVDTVASLSGAVLQVDARADALGADHRLARRLRRWSDAGLLRLRVHDHLTDAELWATLAGLDASVLPYRWGTHSGWLEACRDLGTTVVAPSFGCYAEQGPVLTYHREEATPAAPDGRLDAGTLVDVVRRAHAERPQLGASLDERRRQRAAVAAAHDEVYAAVLAGRATEGATCGSA